MNDYSQLNCLVFCATNARSHDHEWGDSWNAVTKLLQKLNVHSKVFLKRNETAFALDNDGFRFALAKASKNLSNDNHFHLKSLEAEAKTNWKRSRQTCFVLTSRIARMKAFSTASIIDLNRSYQAVKEMCKVYYSYSNFK